MRRPSNRVALIVLFFLLLSTSVVPRSYGQKLYVFCEANDRATDVGPAIKVAADSLKDALTIHVPPDKLVVYNGLGSPWLGPDIHSSDDVARDILVAIEECPATSEDTIFFYWTGHGAFDAYGHYLSVPKGTEYDKARDNAFLRRRAIVEALQSKGVRLTILFTDSCNTLLDAELRFPPLPQEVRERSQSFADRSRDHLVVLPRDKRPSLRRSLKRDGYVFGPPSFLIESLFFEPEGFIDFNSSCPGQESWSQQGKGGYCTQILADVILRMSSEPGFGWSEIFAELDSGLQKVKKEKEKKGDPSARADQEIFCWSPPAKRGERWVSRGDRWSKPVHQPKPGDRIVAVNGRRVDTLEQFMECLNPIDSSLRSAYPSKPDNRVNMVDDHEVFTENPIEENWSSSDNYLDVEQSGSRLVRVLIFTLIDGKDGSTFYLMTDFAVASDFGYTFELDDDQGLVVQSVAEGSPGSKCRFFK